MVRRVRPVLQIERSGGDRSSTAGAGSVGHAGSFPFVKRMKEVLPGCGKLHEAVILVRLLAEEGIVPIVAEDPNLRRRPRRTRRLVAAEIVDPLNYEYILENRMLRWGEQNQARADRCSPVGIHSVPRHSASDRCQVSPDSPFYPIRTVLPRHSVRPDGK